MVGSEGPAAGTATSSRRPPSGRSALRRKLVRLELLFLLSASLSVGPWAQLAPASFWESFPAFGRGWVSTDGPYNEHLIRDVGGLQLGMTVVLLAALWQPTRPLVLVAALASVAWQAPHVVYHLVHVDELPTLADQVAQSVGLITALTVAAALLVVALRWNGEVGGK